MRRQSLQTLFREAMLAYRESRGPEAVRLFRELVASGTSNPKHLSYAGLVIATGDGDVKTGLAWCERAVEIAFYDPLMYINLARLHERTGWRSQAAQVLRKGLRVEPKDRRLLAEIERINPRAPSPIPALDRDHPLNRYLGKHRRERKRRAPTGAKTSYVR